MDINTFKTQFKGDVVTSADPDYTASIARWAINAERPAEVVAFVKDETDVGLAIQYARAAKLPIAIRGGGHSPAGASSSEGGLVIDLSRYLDGAKVDEGMRLAYVGGGALWGAVDRAAIVHGLATVAGTVSHTGVGGLTLGGGFGWLTSEHGMVVDNLVQATIVTADGSIVVANERENSDLFFGLRGGGSNFGVVTEFVYQLHPQRAIVYAGVLVFPHTSLEKVVEAVSNWWATCGEKEGLLQLTTMGPDGKPAVLIVLFYNGSEAEGRANFKAFHDLGPLQDTTKEIPYEELNDMMASIYMKGLTHSKPLYSVISKPFESIITRAEPDLTLTVLYEYFPLGKVVAQPKDRTPFRRDGTPGVCVAAAWKGDLDAPGMTEHARGIVHELAGIIMDGDPGLTESQSLGYCNYDPDAVAGEKNTVPNKAKLVFGKNYPRLQAIKKKYDPDNVFNKWFSISPA
ncbi:hypothetical protein DXG01_012209 [Tephrocybe rancida]|nr:hypothetical protein DXG01_012209 [Tephrocybe rancida]